MKYESVLSPASIAANPTLLESEKRTIHKRLLQHVLMLWYGRVKILLLNDPCAERRRVTVEPVTYKRHCYASFLPHPPPKPDAVIAAAGYKPHVHLFPFPRPQAVERGPAYGVTPKFGVLDEGGVPLIVWLVLQNTHAAIAGSTRKHQPELMGCPRNAERRKANNEGGSNRWG